MFLRPKKTKYMKSHRISFSRVGSSFSGLKFGRIGLIARESGLISAKQVEATRQVINRYIKRKGKIWIRLFPDFPMTSKPTEVRMGKGKGSVKAWFCRVKKGKVLFEVDGLSDIVLMQAFFKARKKLSLKTYIHNSRWKVNKKG